MTFRTFSEKTGEDQLKAVCINLDHIVAIRPDSVKGAHLTLSGGLSISVYDDFDAVVGLLIPTTWLTAKRG